MTPASSDTRGRVRTEPCAKRVRALLDGRVVADSRATTLVWEIPYYPVYYFPAADVVAELTNTGRVNHSPSRGDGLIHDVVIDGITAAGAASRYPESPLEAVRDLVRLDWDLMSQWLEEDEPVHTHARDPHTRVDILNSSRHVRIELDGVTVADSRQPRVLFETGLPPRHYIPLTDCRMELLRSSATESHCPYKGTANYWSVDTGVAVHEDVVWYYRAPFAESQKIAGLISFYDEKVDVFLDDVHQGRPRTHFS